jgi:hypothetical protein
MKEERHSFRILARRLLESDHFEDIEETEGQY